MAVSTPNFNYSGDSIDSSHIGSSLTILASDDKNDNAAMKPDKKSKRGNMATFQEATSIARWMAKQADGNAKKIETNERKRVEREQGAIADTGKQQMKEKRMKTTGDFFEAMTNPAEILENEVQTVPNNWLERFRAAGAEEVLNTDQTFVNFHMEVQRFP